MYHRYMQRCSRYWTLLLFIPFIGIVLVCYLTYRPSDIHNNFEQQTWYSKDASYQTMQYFVNHSQNTMSAQIALALNNTQLQQDTAARCLARWEELRQVEHHDVLFYNMEQDIVRECKGSMIGSMFYPLPAFRSPCWISKSPAHALVFQGNRGMNHTLSRLRRLYSLRAQSSGQGWCMRCLPAVILAGFTKTGTSDLTDVLKTHHLLRGTSIKEFHFWNDVRTGYRGNWVRALSRRNDVKKSFSDYLDLLGEASETALRHQQDGDGPEYFSDLILDSTPSYVWRFRWVQIASELGLDATEAPVVIPDTIHHFLPDVKIIIMMRNPVDRAFSACKAFYKTTCSPELFHDIVKHDIHVYQHCKKNYTDLDCVYRIKHLVREERFVLPSIYYVYVHNWLRVYPREQIFFLRSEDYFSQRGSTSEIFSFLGVDDLSSEQYKKVNNKPIHNKSSRSLKMLNETKHLLTEFYKPFNEKLALLLNDRRYLWT